MHRPVMKHYRHLWKMNKHHLSYSCFFLSILIFSTKCQFNQYFKIPKVAPGFMFRVTKTTYGSQKQKVNKKNLHSVVFVNFFTR